MPTMRTFEPYVLTPLDHLLPPAHMFTFFTFELERPSESIQILQEALSRLLVALPFLSGNVAMSSQIKDKVNLQEVRPADGPTMLQFPMLQVQHHRNKVCAIDWDAIFNQNYIPLPLVMSSSLPIPVARFQANVMKDAVVVCMASHHMAMDGLGAMAVLESLAACCRNAAPITSMILQAEVRKQIAAATSAKPVDHHDGYGQPPHLTAIPISRNFTLSAEKIRKLKETCNSIILGGAEDKAYPTLSSNDIVTALIWICVMRARQANSMLVPGKLTSSLNLGVSVRTILQPGIPRSYIGNAVLVAPCSFPLKAMEGRGKYWAQDLCLLCDVAQAVRSEVQAITNEHVRKIVSHITQSSNWGSFQIQYPDLVVSNLRQSDIYQWDFGSVLGRVSNVDIPDPRFDGLCWIRPANPILTSNPQAGRDQSPPWDLRVVLEESVMQCLQEESFFRWMQSSLPTPESIVSSQSPENFTMYGGGSKL
jgi:fumigaclavine B O-acetyltransferase